MAVLPQICYTCIKSEWENKQKTLVSLIENIMSIFMGQYYPITTNGCVHTKSLPFCCVHKLMVDKVIC